MSEIFYYVTFFCFTLIISFYLNGYINKLFIGNKLTDPVNERSSHKYPATRSGGISVFLTICLACAFGVSTGKLTMPLYALLSVFFVTLTGFIDDLITVRYREKLFLQLFAAILMFQSGYTLIHSMACLIFTRYLGGLKLSSLFLYLSLLLTR